VANCQMESYAMLMVLAVSYLTQVYFREGVEILTRFPCPTSSGGGRGVVNGGEKGDCIPRTP